MRGSENWGSGPPGNRNHHRNWGQCTGLEFDQNRRDHGVHWWLYGAAWWRFQTRDSVGYSTRGSIVWSGQTGSFCKPFLTVGLFHILSDESKSPQSKAEKPDHGKLST